MEDEYRYYEILGLDHNASLSEITKAYRSLAKTFHPDVSSHPRARENFQKIQRAYEALSDPKARGEYNAYLESLKESAPQEDTNEIRIEKEFYVRSESIIVNGRERILENAHHVIVNGQEYIEYNGEFLPLEKQRGGFFKTAAKWIFVLVIVFTLWHGYTIATSGNAATPENNQIHTDPPAAVATVTATTTYSDSDTVLKDHMYVYELPGKKGTVYNINYKGNGPVDLLILNPENYYRYDRALDGLSSGGSVWGQLYLNKREANIKFTQPDDQQYRFIIDNTYLMTDGANSGRAISYTLTIS